MDCSYIDNGRSRSDIWQQRAGWAAPVCRRRLFAPAGNGAVYFRLVNTGNEADILLSIDSPLAVAEVHQTAMKENGVMGMEPVDSVEIPAKGEAVFKQGGLHVMLIGLEQPLAAGDMVPADAAL